MLTIGLAVVTRDQAAVWTDGRYFLQAEGELDCNWILMKMGQTNKSGERERERALLYRKLLKKATCILFVKVKISAAFKHTCTLSLKSTTTSMKLKMLTLICISWKMTILRPFVGESGVPSSTEWMVSVLASTTNAKVGAYPFLINSGK